MKTGQYNSIIFRNMYLQPVSHFVQGFSGNFIYRKNQFFTAIIQIGKPGCIIQGVVMKNPFFVKLPVWIIRQQVIKIALNTSQLILTERDQLRLFIHVVSFFIPAAMSLSGINPRFSILPISALQFNGSPGRTMPLKTISMDGSNCRKKSSAMVLMVVSVPVPALYVSPFISAFLIMMSIILMRSSI